MVPSRASDVAQPPSAGVTAESGGAPCVTTNAADRAKQSQLALRGGSNPPPNAGRTRSQCRENTVSGRRLYRRVERLCLLLLPSTCDVNMKGRNTSIREAGTLRLLSGDSARERDYALRRHQEGGLIVDDCYLACLLEVL